MEQLLIDAAKTRHRSILKKFDSQYRTYINQIWDQRKKLVQALKEQFKKEIAFIRHNVKIEKARQKSILNKQLNASQQRLNNYNQAVQPTRAPVPPFVSSSASQQPPKKKRLYSRRAEHIGRSTNRATTFATHSIPAPAMPAPELHPTLANTNNNHNKIIIYNRAKKIICN